MAEGPGGALRQLVAYLGFNLDEKGLDKAEKGVDRLKEKSETLTKAFELVGVALGAHEIGEFISSQIEMGAALEHTSQQLGIGVDDLQAFQYAAQTTGVTADDASNALGFLSRAMGAAGQGQEEAAKAFAQFHVALKNADGSARDVADVIEDLADGFAKTNDNGKKTYAAMTLFGRSGRALIPLLNKGRDGVRGLYEEFGQLGGGLSEEFIADAEEAEHGMVKLKTASRGLSSEVGAALLPYVSDFVSLLASGIARLREWTQHTHFLRNALITLAAVAGVLVITWGILNIEILLVVAALALLALAVDDVITFFEAGDSALGRFLDRLYGVGESKHIAKDLEDAWKGVSDAFGKLWDAVKSLGPDLQDLFNTFTKNSDGTPQNTIKGIADAMKDLVGWLTKATTELDSLLKKFDDFAKAHPLLVHAVQRAGHQVGQGNVGIGGALKAVGGDLSEIFTGDTSINSYDEPGKGKVSAPGNFHVPVDVPLYVGGSGISPPANVQQHNETHIQLYGVSGGQDAARKVQDAVKDGQTDANNAAFAAVGGGGAP